MSGNLGLIYIEVQFSETRNLAEKWDFAAHGKLFVLDIDSRE